MTGRTRSTKAAAMRTPRTGVKRQRLWDDPDDEDPLATIANLFDVALVFTIALVMALAASMRNATIDVKRAQPLQRYRLVEQTASGDGTRLGTAYQLPNGDVVYVPDR